MEKIDLTFTPLKKGILIFFIFQLLTANVFAESIFGLPSLFEHYQEHKQNETPGISFLDFMMMHYLNEAHESSDKKHHHNLPLKDLSCLVSHSFDYSVPQAFTFDVQPVFSFLEKATTIPYVAHLSSNYSGGIFQPPRA